MTAENRAQEDFEHAFVQLVFPGNNVESPAVSTNEPHTNIDIYTNTLGAALWLGTAILVYARVPGGRVLVGDFAVGKAVQRVSVTNVAANGFDVTVTPTGDVPTTPLVVSAVAYGVQPGQQSPFPLPSPPGAATAVLEVVNGLNTDLAVQPSGLDVYYLLDGATAPFSISGIVSNTTPADGQRVTLLNPNFDGSPTTGQQMTIKHNDLADESANPQFAIFSGTGADAVYPPPPPRGFTTVTFVYSTVVSRWLLIGV